MIRDAVGSGSPGAFSPKASGLWTVLRSSTSQALCGGVAGASAALQRRYCARMLGLEIENAVGKSVVVETGVFLVLVNP